MGVKRIGLSELEQVRRRRKKTLNRIAEETGLNVCAVWRVLRRKSFDLRQITKVTRAIGVPLHRLDLESFLGEQPQGPGAPDATEKAQKTAQREAAGDEGPAIKGVA